MTMTERLEEITRRNNEAEELLNMITTAFDPGNLLDLIVFDDEGDTVAKFSMEHTRYQVHEGKLLVEYYGDELHTFPLNRFSYCTQAR